MAMAGQHSRIAKHGGTHGDSHAGRHDHGRVGARRDSYGIGQRHRLEPARDARLRRARSHSARAGGDRLERIRRGSGPGHRAHESAQAHSRAGSDAGANSVHAGLEQLSARTASVLAFLGLVGCVLSLYWTHSLFGDNPVAIAIQVAAVALMAWARITF